MDKADEQPTITQADALTVLQNLSSYVGAGGLDVTDVTSLDERIRWGIDVQVSVAIQRAADIVEECSKVPSTRWGQVKAAILALDTCKQPCTRTTSLAAQDGLVEAVAEALLSAFLAGRGSVTSDGRKAYKPAPSMADFRSIALSAIKEQHHD